MHYGGEADVTKMVLVAEYVRAGQAGR